MSNWLCLRKPLRIIATTAKRLKTKNQTKGKGKHHESIPRHIRQQTTKPPKVPLKQRPFNKRRDAEIKGGLSTATLNSVVPSGGAAHTTDEHIPPPPGPQMLFSITLRNKNAFEHTLMNSCKRTAGNNKTIYKLCQPLPST